MNNNSKAFTVISASAGAGKTYKIAKEFIKYILPEPGRIREILAITFTNKAAAEMKERVLTFLIGLSGNETLLDENQQGMVADLRQEMLAELGWDKQQLRNAAVQCINNILYSVKAGGYSDFSVMTIDSFTNRLTKVFSYELNIPMNYAVGMNVKNIIRSAVEKVISIADPMSREGSDITQIVLQFLLYRVQEEKHLMIESEMVHLSEDLRRLEKNFNQSIDLPRRFTEDFKRVVDEKLEFVGKFENTVTGYCEEIWQLVNDFHNGGDIPYDQYHQGKRGFLSYIRNYIDEPGELRLSRLLTSSYCTDVLSDMGIDRIRKKDSKKAELLHTDEGTAYLNDMLAKTKEMYNYIYDHVQEYYDSRIILKHIYANLLYENINTFIEQYQRENSVIFIDELNSKISSLFEHSSDVPFVYFRIGEKYRKFMIDEFQDTSIMQWVNIKPLVDEAIARNGECISVGDLKQAIYRFRGGSTDVMEHVEKYSNVAVEHLESNWRSRPNIIALNNFIFSNVNSDMAYVNNDIYSPVNVEQAFRKATKPVFTNKEGEGYCEITLLEKDVKLNEEIINNQRIVEIIRDILKRGYIQSSIGILVRGNEQGNRIAQLLSGMEIEGQQLRILSADTLYIKDNPYVKFIISMLKYSFNRQDDEAFFNMIYLWNDIAADKSGFIRARDRYTQILLSRDKENRQYGVNEKEKNELLKLLWGDTVYASYKERIMGTVNNITVYESISIIMEIFINPHCGDYSSSIAHICKLRDEAYKRMKEENTLSFLAYYDEYKESLHIPAPATKNAITISTIHKSKGLQYDIVIVPFASWNSKQRFGSEYFIYDKPAIAVQYTDINTDCNECFREGMIERKEVKIEETFFDDINLLYVAMTRAKRELYVFSNYRETKKNEHYDTIERLLTHKCNLLDSTYIKHDIVNGLGEQWTIGTKDTYMKKESEEEHIRQMLTVQNHKKHMFIDRKMKYIIGKHSEKSREISRGNIMHNMLSYIHTAEDIDYAIRESIKSGEINIIESESYKNALDDIIRDNNFRAFFEPGYTVYNERDIVFNGQVVRPDRVLIRNNEAIIIDYKTGREEAVYKEQMRHYMAAYRSMGYSVRGFIAYTASREAREVSP